MIIKVLLALITSAVFPIISCAQKNIISYETYKSWQKVQSGGLSNDGKYAFYTIKNFVPGKNSFILTSTGKNWTKQFPEVSSPIFSSDSKFLFGKLSNDTLLMINVISKEVTTINSVTTFQNFELENKEYIAYLRQSTLTIRSLTSGNSISFDGVNDFIISPNRHFILINKVHEVSDNHESMVELVEVVSGSRKQIYNGDNVIKMIFNDKSDQIAMVVGDGINNSIWYFKPGLASSILLAAKYFDGEKNSFTINESNFQFTKDNKSLFFSIKPTDEKKSKKSSRLSIWNYKDVYLIGDNGSIKDNNYLSVIEIDTKNIRQLIKANESISNGSFTKLNDSVLVVESSFGNIADEPFIQSAKITYWLCFTRSGKRIMLEKEVSKPWMQIAVSPSGKYVVFYDSGKGDYYSINIKKGDKKNLTENIPDKLQYYQLSDYPRQLDKPVGISGWLKTSDNFIVNSRFNLWCIDPAGIQAPINLTKLKGTKDDIIFKIPLKSIKDRLEWNKNIIVTAFNILNKNFSIYRIRLSNSPNIVKLWTGSFYFPDLENVYFEIDPVNFILADNSKKCLLLLEKPTQAPNYFFSDGLKKFRAISRVNPQQKYNWLTAELQEYTDTLGRIYQGILYKPENFDPSKKYPVIFQYYEKLSNTLNSFPSVEPPPAGISIPIAVSNGYLVFLPDMLSKPGDVGEGALNSILSAAKYLSTFPWVDNSKFGLSGHSFGGYETNFIITHTPLFRAALSGAGNSDLISQAYETWAGSGRSKQSYFQFAAPKMGDALADNPNSYVKNSPILYVKYISTPLLLLHNSKDNSVPFRQSKQMFIAMRSLQKPVWLLNYEDETHGIGQKENALDFSKKVFGFFDHFLKDKDMPSWMNNAISAENPQPKNN